LKNPELIYEQHPSSKEEENIFYYCNIAAASSGL